MTIIFPADKILMRLEESLPVFDLQLKEFVWFEGDDCVHDCGHDDLLHDQGYQPLLHDQGYQPLILHEFLPPQDANILPKERGH